MPGARAHRGTGGDTGPVAPDRSHPTSGRLWGVTPSTEPAPAGRPMRGPTRDEVCLERPWPSAAVWLGLLVMAGFSGVVALPFGLVPGIVTAAVVLALLGGVLVVGTPAVGVRGTEFVAGRAHVPLALVGEVTVLDAAGMRQAHGPGLDARAHLCLRGWVRPGLRLDLVDPQDPTPYWLVSCRRPRLLADAVEARRPAG